MRSILTTSCAIHFGDTAYQALHSYLQSSNHSKIIVLVDVNTKASCLPVLIDNMANNLQIEIIEIPNGELAAPTNDINTTVALSLLTSISYFYAGISKKGLGYFKRYVSPAVFLLPINVLEDFTKPLSLSFRLFGNIVAEELVVAVLISLVPLVVPIPIMLLGVFTSGIQALVFATLAGAYIGEAVEDHH